MIKQIWIAQCDLCGKTEEAGRRTSIGQYNEAGHTLPKGWGYGYTEKIHLCQECFERMMNITKIEEEN